MTLIKYCEDGIRHVDYWSVLKVINDHEVTCPGFFDPTLLNYNCLSTQ